MASRPAATRAASVTRDQNQHLNQNQDHVRTRSQLALPEFNIEYDRSPLKNAREALRRANARFGQPSDLDGGKLNGGGDVDANVDTKMEVVMARTKSDSASNPFRRGAMEKGADGREDVGTGGEGPEELMESVGDQESFPTTPRPPSNSLDFSIEGDGNYPKYPKRARSSSFGERRPPSLVITDTEGGNNTSNGSSSSPHSNTLGVASGHASPTRSPTAATLSDSTGKTNDESNPKRVKLGGQSTLETFFTRPSASQPKPNGTKQAQPPTTSVRRIFSEAASSSSHPADLSLLPRNNKPMVGEEAHPCPKTPTIKELRAIPSLDLRTVTPSPRKRALQIGLGTPGHKVPLHSRAVSAGAALVLARPQSVMEDMVTLANEAKEENSGATGEPHEDDAGAHHDTLRTLPRRMPNFTIPLPPNVRETESRSMDDADKASDATKQDEVEARSTVDCLPPTITISTSTSSIITTSVPEEIKWQRNHSESLPPGDTFGVELEPCTPRQKFLPSRPLPSGHLPSAKSNLSTIFSTSPLTPLSVLGAPSDEYDYQEEERSVQEEDSRISEREAAKLTMQAEGEPESDNGAELSDVKTGPLFAPGSATASSSVPRKPSSKGKQKGKPRSSVSRTVTGAAGVKKRKSLAPITSMTPRMRLTRASVLRQKAIQAQMHTPGDKRRRSSIHPTKVPGTTIAKDNDGEKDKEKSKEGTAQQGLRKPDKKKKVESEPQRPPRKTFVLTVPSSLSPRKSSSASNSADSSVTLKSGSSPSKAYTFSLYPPSLNDVAATEQAKNALNKLSSALDKLAMPPPIKPNSSASRSGAELRRPASEQKDRIRPASSLGFMREMSVPITGTASRGNERPVATSRAGSVEPAKRFLPPPPVFGSSLSKGKGKTKAFTSASRTAPVALGGNKGRSIGNSQIRPPSSFRFGVGAGGVFGRPIPRMRASQKTSLETVQGSPVKGGVQPQDFKEDDEDEIVPIDVAGGQGDPGADADASASSSNANGDTSISSTESGDTSTSTSTGGKELKRISKLNASRRASMAFSTLAQTLGASPDAFSPFYPKESHAGSGNAEESTPTVSAPPDKKGAAGSTSSSASSRPVRAAAPRSFGFGARGLARTQSESIVGNSGRARSVTPSVFSESDSEGPNRSGTKKSGGSMGRTKMPGSLDVLDRCTVFVDVRTEEGEDAGALFVDMLRGLGAKVLTRVGQSCTHIVYKNGLSSTVTRYRLLDEPRPKVIGIGWVVECAEKRAQVDESRFQVDLENANIAGTLKRRRSFLPKQMSSSSAPGPMDSFLNGSTSGSDTATIAHPVPKACADSDLTSEDGDANQERVLSASSLNSSIHPLERARRRSIMITR